LLVLLFLVLGRLGRVQKPDIPGLLPAVAVGSLLAITSSVMIPPMAFLVLAAMLRLERATAVRLAVLLTIGVTIVLLPWEYRNHKELWKWIFTRSNFGLELWLSNNDRATADYNTNVDRGIMEMHPATTLEQCAKLRAVGEMAFHAAAMRNAQDWIAANPQGFLALTAERTYLF
jgi:hypothetical protein